MNDSTLRAIAKYQKEKRKLVSLAMKNEVYDRLKELAEKDGRTVSGYIIEMIKEDIAKPICHKSATNQDDLQ